MIFPSKNFLQNRWSSLLLCFSLFLLAAQCNTPPTPPLPAAPDEPSLRIALLSPSEGELATFGRMTRNGSMMAFDQWNQNGGVLGHHITWDIYNTDCNFDTAREAAQQAIAQGHTFIIGPLCSEAAIGAAAVVEKERVLMISPTATHPLVTVDGQGETRPSIFRASYAWPLQAEAAAHFVLDDLKTTQAAILTMPNDDYGVMLADTFAQTFTAQDGGIVYKNTISFGNEALPNILTDIQQAGATVIYLPVETMLANQIGSQLETMDLSNITLLGSDSWNISELDLAATDGSYITTHFAADNPDPDVQAWANTYKSIYAIEPNTLAALGYDAALLLLNAIEKAQSLDSTAVTRVLKQETFGGVTGPIQFNTQHNPIKPVPIIHIKNNNIVFKKSVSP